MDFRPGSSAVRSSLVVAGVAHRSHTGKSEDAGRSGVICTETCRKGWQAVQVP